MSDMKRFLIEVTVSEWLTLDEIWPDGDAPENPTVSDVRMAFLEDGRGNPLDAARDWNLDGNLDITEMETEP